MSQPLVKNTGSKPVQHGNRVSREQSFRSVNHLVYVELWRVASLEVETYLGRVVAT